MESTIGGRIKELAQAKGFNMRAFSQFCHISASAIHAITSGKSNPSYEMMEKIAAAFPEASMDWLLMGHGQMNKAEGVAFKLRAPEQSEPLGFPAANDSACWEILKREEAQHQLLKKDYEELKALLRQARIDLFLLQQKDGGPSSASPID